MEQKTILLVDDDPIIHELVKARLADLDGYSVESLYDGANARSYLKRMRPDTVLLDWVLPDEPGIRVLRWLKGRSKTMWVPVFMLTARGGMSDVEKCLEAGASGHFSKPVNLNLLSTRLARLYEDLQCA